MAGRFDDERQLLSDVLRNAKGAPELVWTIGSGMGELGLKGGAALGAGAGMLASALRGEEVRPDLAEEAMNEATPDITWRPRTEGGQETLKGLGQIADPADRWLMSAGEVFGNTVGGAIPYAGDKTKAALGAAGYAAANLADPEMLLPGRATVAALRQANSAAARYKWVPPEHGTMGAWNLGDIVDEEGDFSIRYPTEMAWDKLKPQEQGRITGVQLRKALMREGAKKDFLSWSGMDDILNSNEVINTADARRVFEENKPVIESRSKRGSDEGESGDIDENTDEFREAVQEHMDNNGNLQYPEDVYVQLGQGRRNREHIGSTDGSNSTQDIIDQWKADKEEQYADEIYDNMEDHYADEDEGKPLAELTDDEQRSWANDRASGAFDDTEFDEETNYDNGAFNEDDERERAENYVRNNPEAFNLSNSNAPSHRFEDDYAEHTVGREGTKPEANYTVTTGRLMSEGRFGKGKVEPSFLSPYKREIEAQGWGDIQDPNQMPLQLHASSTGSKAFEIEALRQAKRDADPNIGMYRKDEDLSHFGSRAEVDLGENQQWFTRATDEFAPDFGTVQQGVGPVPGAEVLRYNQGELKPSNPYRPARAIQEIQSDLLQALRKRGEATPEGLEKLQKTEGSHEEKLQNWRNAALNQMRDVINLPDVKAVIDEQLASPNPAEKVMMKNALALYNHSISQVPQAPFSTRQKAAKNLMDIVWGSAPYGSKAESLTNGLRNALGNLDNHTATFNPVASSHIKETKQYMTHALIDEIHGAVMEGQQYLLWTPGDVHAERWGSETMQWAPSSENPRVMNVRAPGQQRIQGRLENGQTPMQFLQREANENVIAPDEHTRDVYKIDLDAPDVDAQLFRIVLSRFAGDLDEFPNPAAKIRDRAAQLRTKMQAAAERATTIEGPHQAEHSSPRAEGTKAAYDVIEGYYNDVMKANGIKDSPKVRRTMMHGKEMIGIEINPELARAAKRGLIFPY